MSRANKVYRLLGLARRAGAVAPGTDAVRHAIRAGDARLIVTADDASPTQLLKIASTLHERTIPQASVGDRDALGAAIGLAPVAAVAVTSASLAQQLLAELDAPNGSGGPLGAEE